MQCTRDQRTSITNAHEKDEIHNVDPPDHIVTHPGNDMTFGNLNMQSIKTQCNHCYEEKDPYGLEETGSLNLGNELLE